MEFEQWEYTRETAGTLSVDGLVERLNRLGTYGWELVGFASVDKTIGINSLHAVLRRRIHPLPHPEERSPGWRPDPSGRHEVRYWTGEVWSRKVRTGKSESDDAPTAFNAGPADERLGPISNLCRIGRHGAECNLRDKCTCPCHH